MSQHAGRTPLPPRPQLTVPVPVDADGERGPTKKQARGPSWRRTGHGLYVPASLPDDGPDQRVLEAACRLPWSGAVTGWAALHWVGAWWHDGSRPAGPPRPVPLVTGMVRCRPGLGAAISQERLAPDEVTVVDGVRVTAPARSVLFEMRYAGSVREAVVALDMAVIADVVSLAEVAEWCERLQGWTGVPRARAALPLADENSWSPAESRLRLVWVLDAELPAPRCNVPIFDRDGRFVAVPDLLDEESGLVVEYDGAVHLEGDRRRRDQRRERAIRSLGLEYLAVVADDTDRRRLAETLVAARRAARARRSRDRGWTTSPPPGWLPSHTVALRRGIERGDRRAALPPRRPAAAPPCPRPAA